MQGKTNVYNFSFSNQFSNIVSTLNENDFTPSNGLTYRYYQDDYTKDWELAILTSGTITFNKNINVDIFIVGGGKNGGNGSFNVGEGEASGGKGGNGGECVYSQVSITKNTNYTITIGNNDNNTIGFGLTAESGGGFEGGIGSDVRGSNKTRYSYAAPGTSSIYYAFYTQGSSHFYPDVTFGAGGGGGRSCGYHPTEYNIPDSTSWFNHSGGETGGGGGGGWNDSYQGEAGSPGTNNYGGGGGGGGAANGGVGAGGAGGTGIIILHSSDFNRWRVPVTGISLDVNTLTVATNSQKTLTATVLPAEASNQYVIWSSNNENIATVSNGIVTGVSEGNAIITAKTEEGEFVASCSITVVAETVLFSNGAWTSTIGNWALRNSGSSSGWSTGGSSNITNNNLIIGTTSGGAHTSVYGTENTINLSDYTTLNIRVTNYTNGSSQDTNNVKLALSSSKTVSNWNPGAYASDNPSGVVSGKTVVINGPGTYSIDISNITTSYYIWFTSASHSQVLTVIEKIWLS